MSSDEDFSFAVSEGTETMEGIRKEINKMKERHSLVLQEQQDLAKAVDHNKDLEQKCNARTAKLRTSLDEDQSSYDQDYEREKERQAGLLEEEIRLKNEIERAQGEQHELEKMNHDLKQQSTVSTAVPEKKVVFTGVTGSDANAKNFEMRPHILYPMEGGTALITFEEEVVASKILSLVEHRVELGERDGTTTSVCSITLEARPVHLLLPSHVEMDTQICPRRILVSDLPSKVSEEVLKDKLELHFSKRKNGGGEVDDSDLLQDSGNVVIAFIGRDVAKNLADKQYHDVEFVKGKKHRVMVTPFLNGKVTNFQTRLYKCDRTVLLSGIPDVMEQENLQDLLEIHFQKARNGGGEVEAFLYNPVGHQTLALFQEDAPSKG